MEEGASAGAVFGEAELIRLTELYYRFEAALDPLSADCKAAREEFNGMVNDIYFGRAKEVLGIDYDCSRFRSFVRRLCRERLAKQGPPFPCPPG